jgi:DNA polymerase
LDTCDTFDTREKAAEALWVLAGVKGVQGVNGKSAPPFTKGKAPPPPETEIQSNLAVIRVDRISAVDTFARRDTANLVFLDFETRNVGVSALAKAGAWCYAGDPHTEILTLVFQNGAGKPRLWVPSDGLSNQLASIAADPSATFVCFGDFELVVWDRIMVERYGFPEIPISRWHNAQAACSYLALPRTLGKVLPIIGAPVVKDGAGRRLVLSLSRPVRKTGAYPDVTPEVLERVHAYNKIDVEGLTAIHAAVGPLPERERKVWELDQQINKRGIQIDTEFVWAAKQIAETFKGTLLDEFAGLTKGLSPYQVSATRDWLKERGFALENLQDDTVNDALDDLILPRRRSPRPRDQADHRVDLAKETRRHADLRQ